MNTISIVIGLLLAAAVIAAFVSARRNKGSCGGCSGCSGCEGCGGCSRNCGRKGQ